MGESLCSIAGRGGAGVRLGWVAAVDGVGMALLARGFGIGCNQLGRLFILGDSPYAQQTSFKSS